MPNKPAVRTAQKDRGSLLLLEDNAKVQELVDAEQVALRELTMKAASATEPLSLRSWKHCCTELTDITDKS